MNFRSFATSTRLGALPYKETHGTMEREGFTEDVLELLMFQCTDACSEAVGASSGQIWPSGPPKVFS
jgi:hypothetical protein